MNYIIFIMGVSGSGKTTIGQLLSDKTGYAFYDADNFHTNENVEKMKAGLSLTDDDRYPWLNNIHQFASIAINSATIIIACSALKQNYRNQLSKGIEKNCKWFFLNGEYNTILNRMQQRTDHFMPSVLLESQFQTLEIPNNAIELDITISPELIVTIILHKIEDFYSTP